MKDLKQVVDVVSFRFKLLKCSQVMIKHLECKNIKVGDNLIGHRFTMANWKCQTLQIQKIFVFNESKLQGMT
jgi:hypothetical protein